MLTSRSTPNFIRSDDGFYERSFAYVELLAVAREYRDMGIAKLLLGILSNPKIYPMAASTSGIFLHVLAGNIAAIKAYKNSGFVHSVFVPGLYRGLNFEDGFEMLKLITRGTPTSFVKLRERKNCGWC